MQAQFLIPAAASLGYGILFATFITLLLTPALLLIYDDISGVFNRALSNQPLSKMKQPTTENKQS
jgi:hypothetical protein